MRPSNSKGFEKNTRSTSSGAKAAGDAGLAADSIDHLRGYTEMLFGIVPRQANAQ